MSQTSCLSTQYPPPTFDNENETPKYLYEQLEALSEWANDGKQLLVKLSNESDRTNCMNVMRNFYDHVIYSFPSAEQYPWETIHERIKFINTSFDVFPFVGAAFCAENDFQNFSKLFFSRVLGVCHVLESWIDVPDVPNQDGYPTPMQLHDKGERACIGLLRAWLGCLSTEKSGLRGWEVAKDIATQCITLCQDLLHGNHTEETLYVFPLSNPRLYQGPLDNIEAPPTARLTLNDRSRLPLLLTSLLKIVLQAISPPLASDWFLADTMRTTVDCALQAFGFIASPSCVTTGIIRARSMTRLTIAISSSLQMHPTYSGMAESLRLHLLLGRLHDGPNECWDKVEDSLLEAFIEPISTLPSRTDTQSILSLVAAEQWGESGGNLRALAAAYLCSIVPYAGADLLHEIKSCLTPKEHVTQYIDILDAATRRLLALQDAPMDVEMSHYHSERQAWRRGIRTVVQAIIEPDDLAWMDDDESLSDAQYIARALSDIETRFDRQLYDPSCGGRIALARELCRLSCALARHLDSPCPAMPNRSSVSTIPIGMRIVIKLLEGTENEITSMVQKSAYDALARIIRHHTSGFGPAMTEPVCELVVKGMKQPDRSVRLSAGRCLAELIKMYQDKGPQGAQYTESMFRNIDIILTRYTDRIKETTLITAGLIAKQANAEILYRAIICLISQFGDNNPVLKGTAVMQLASVVEHHGKSRYGLLQAYMEQISVFIVDRIITHPSLLTEYCNFLGATRAEFFTATMDAVVPHLFATCNGPALALVAIELSCDVASLFWKRQAKILAHAHMTTIPGHRQKSLNFILSFFKTAEGQPVVEASDLIVSSLIDLISELVMNMGDEDEAIVQAAIHGMMKVEDTLDHRVPRTQPKTSHPTLGTFLETHILGVITHMIEVLDDMKGKRTLTEKKCVCRAVGKVVLQIGPPVNAIGPQIMAMLRTMLAMPDLRDITVHSWHTFLHVIDVKDLGPYIGPTGAAFLAAWPSLSLHSKGIVKDCMHYLVVEKGAKLGTSLDELADLTSIPELNGIGQRLASLRKDWTPEYKLQILLTRVTSENLNVATGAMEEMRRFLLHDDESFVRNLASGDTFDPLLGKIYSALLLAACRDGLDSEPLRMLAFDCIGIVGAADPYRFEVDSEDGKMIVTSNFTNDVETTMFVVHLIKDVLAGAYRSTSDMQYQRDLAYSIQELLKICDFTESLVTPGSSAPIQLKTRSRWNVLPKSVVETITPLLTSRYKLHFREPGPIQRPIYHTQATYREWIQTWMTYLIPKAAGDKASRIFSVFSLVVKNRDVGVARYLLPHLILNVLIGGEDEAVDDIRSELLVVLQDQVDSRSISNADKKELSAQTVFMVMDHLNRWVRTIRQTSKGVPVMVQGQLTRIDSILSNIDQTLMAKAAFQCKAYARALMCFEQQIVFLRNAQQQTSSLQEHYERLHEIYAQLDEPDGMEGTSTLILSPSLEHQVRQHEITGRWTAAQSCWEVNLQHDPNDLKSHLGLLRCLRHLGHYDTMRTHVEGILTRYPEWRSELIGYQVESGCIVGDWDKVRYLVQQTDSESPSILLARILLAMDKGDEEDIKAQLALARRSLGAPILAVGAKGYRRCYDAILDLHLVHELDVIYRESVSSARQTAAGDVTLGSDNLQQRLSARLESTLPSFRIREPILSTRRTVFGLRAADDRQAREAIGQAWLLSAKLARKAGYWHTAYSAVLQAQHSTPAFTTIESARLAKASGEPVRALQELDNYYRTMKAKSNTIDLIDEDDTKKRLRAKAFILRARWMNDSDRYETKSLSLLFEEGNSLLEWESGQFHWGQFQDKCFKEQLPSQDRHNRALLLNMVTIECYAKAIRYGSKCIYQTVPRLLTLWLDMGAEAEPGNEAVAKATKEVYKSFKASPRYKWYTAFPQMLSRIGHNNKNVFGVLKQMILTVLKEYPRQGLWLFVSTVNSDDLERHKRGIIISDKLKNIWDDKLVTTTFEMGVALIELCNREPPPDRKPGEVIIWSMIVKFPTLYKLAPCDLLIPLQESLVANLPPSSAKEAAHQPFPMNPPTMQKWHKDVVVMSSLAAPKKIGIYGNDGKLYSFLGKPKDDLRKDARIMELDAIINKFLKADSESRRRQLHIRTYGVITLNDTCGFIQWVPKTIALRKILQGIYESRGISCWNSSLQRIVHKVQMLSSGQAGKAFEDNVLILFPRVFHEWFIETFPEPSTWLASRLSYTRTAAVMSMVGYILGLGDRHCENILLDSNNGDVVHVDFNCLFERGQRLQCPERVPFRLTENMLDGFGVTGVEGAFRTACELSMRILRHNKDCLRTILDAYIHDPLAQWQDDMMELEKKAADAAKRKRQAVIAAKTVEAEVESTSKGVATAKNTGAIANVKLKAKTNSRANKIADANAAQAANANPAPIVEENVVIIPIDKEELARKALTRIERKLNGLFVAYRDKEMESTAPEREVPTNSLVDMLIREATSNAHLAKMWQGWSAWL